MSCEYEDEELNKSLKTIVAHCTMYDEDFPLYEVVLEDLYEEHVRFLDRVLSSYDKSRVRELLLAILDTTPKKRRAIRVLLDLE